MRKLVGAPSAPPTGWALIRADSCNSGTFFSYYKVAGNSEPSTYTWTLASSYNAAAIVDAGVTAPNPVDVISAPVCGSAPTIAGLTISNQAENVITIGAGTNGNVPAVTFSAGAVAVSVPASGILPIAIDFLTANYPTTPSITLPSGAGTDTAAQMIAIAPSGTYSQRAVLQGDGYAELTKLRGTFGGDDSISKFNMNGDFNVKNPIYGAQGDGITDDTAAIQAAFNAACAQGGVTNSSQTLFFPAGTYLTSFPIISNCATPIQFVGES